ncbi:hypothetical protein Vadar_000621 [Vaccinium darrowii]|uniref:Uncharacterized protein n=1 Tax=Vaccinium darrowii TaxID=229202 RepID=A0ACB7X779_9ERIC|nr:hypothetical protein Vadar_000621 [Vaccinium darrowii]
MEPKITHQLLSSISLLLLLLSSSHSNPLYDNLVQCLSQNSPSFSPITSVFYTPSNDSYSFLLQSSIQNLRFSTPKTPKPLAIITPEIDSHVQATVICCRKHQLQLRIRSGGHDYEGLSYTSSFPFIILDLVHIKSISVNLEENSVWVDAGATLGELYYRIAERSPVHGFPAGICPTVGVGGHFSGGGFGTMLRKYGLAADNIIDAYIVDVDGRILNRELMGEGLFWAIRGGGGASFGVILSFKIKLVYVPTTVTVFSIHRTLEEDATKLVHKWQYIGDKFDENLFIRIIIEAVGEGTNRTIQATFNSLFLGRANQVLKIMKESYPELSLQRKHCTEMSWIESVLYFSGYPKGETLDALINRKPQPKSLFKAASDFVQEPLPETALEEIWKWCLEEEKPILILDPYGGRMSQIPESALPFPHRKGNLYNIQYLVKWEDENTTENHMNWLRRVHEHMTPYVSQCPRAAYFNYRDIDLGRNEGMNSTYSEAMVWGTKYFKQNFRRLAVVKGEVDPGNFFTYEQSIPPLFLDGESREICVENKNKNLFLFPVL